MKKVMFLVVMLLWMGSSYSQKIKEDERPVFEMGFIPIFCWVVQGDSLIPFDIFSGEILSEPYMLCLSKRGGEEEEWVEINPMRYSIKDSRPYIIEDLMVNGRRLVRLSESLTGVLWR